MNRLRFSDGTKVKWSRAASGRSEVTPHPIDIYDLQNSDGARVGQVYICMYCKRNSNRAPSGYILADEETGRALPSAIREMTLKALFNDIYPVIAENSRAVVEFVDLKSLTEANAEYCAATFRLILFGLDAESGDRTVTEILEMDAIFPRLPLPLSPSKLSPEYIKLLERQRKKVELLIELDDIAIRFSNLFVLSPSDFAPDFECWLPVDGGIS